MSLLDLNKKLIKEAGVVQPSVNPVAPAPVQQPVVASQAVQPQQAVQQVQQAPDPRTTINNVIKTVPQLAADYISKNKQLPQQNPTQLVSGALSQLLINLKRQLGLK